MNHLRNGILAITICMLPLPASAQSATADREVMAALDAFLEGWNSREIERFADAAGIEITGLHYGECSLCMIGPGQFNELILPALNGLAERLGPLRLHSCGHSDHLLDSFQGVRQLV